jgi:hypothetical protein
MTTRFLLNKDVNGAISYALPFADVKKGVVLASGVEQHFTMPVDSPKYEIHFAYESGASVWVAKNATAALPTGTLADINSELNPIGRVVNAGNTISLITNNDTCEVGVMIYAL